MDMSRQPWEIGSEFHWMGFPQEPFLPWPKPCIWFGLGRSALLAVWHKRTEDNPQRTLWIPDYFCPEVADCWEEAGVTMRRYADDPRWSAPDWDTLTPKADDLVLAVNYFGIREGDGWRQWHQCHPFVVLIEDHSHDPFSPWAQTSTAEYAFASIRKIFPVPDGALLWSPRNYPLPPEPENQDWRGSALKLAAMVWKKEYLDASGRGSGIKETYRTFQTEGEQVLSQSDNPSLANWSRCLLAAGFPQQWRVQREANVRVLLDLLTGYDHFKPLFVDWAPEGCPFNVVLVFDSASCREAFLQQLITRGIYAAVHWTMARGFPEHTVDLSRRILTIPVDQRYHTEDMKRIASIFREISSNYTF
jgi:hypothetical protein